MTEIKIGPSAGSNRAARNKRRAAGDKPARGIPVALSPLELMLAAEVGAKRHARSLIAGRQDYGGYKGAGWDIHIEGACGEMAFAKGMGLYWTGAGEQIEDDSDVCGFQIRTRSRHDYELYVWPKEDPAATFVLVTGRAPNFQIQGWYEGARAQAHPEWLLSPTGREKAYFVPIHQLHSLDSLPEVAK